MPLYHGKYEMSIVRNSDVIYAYQIKRWLFGYIFLFRNM